MSQDLDRAVRAARALRDAGIPLEDVISNNAIPRELATRVRELLTRDEMIELTPVISISKHPNRADWVNGIDRTAWHYWPTIRRFLLARKGWDRYAVTALEDSSDQVLKQLERPDTPKFDIRGLVLGYVQSGKTANYTAVIAKAADAGYRLVIVLAGIDNGLRMQTNIRLRDELVGCNPATSKSVEVPPLGKRWHEFTSTTLEGDFRPGFVNAASLQGSQPVLMVIKKNGTVLRRLLEWLDKKCEADVRKSIPTLVIDDEADQASVDTRGTYQSEEEPLPADYEPPSIINGLIRELLVRFDRRAYVAYTATPFANILIPHDAYDPSASQDLYPKDFIIDLPKPEGYFGAEELFGRVDPDSGQVIGGIDAIRTVPDTDLAALNQGQLPDSLRSALHNFVLAGAARAQRGKPDAPATMLIHTSQRVASQDRIYQLVRQAFNDMRDEWRYYPKHQLHSQLKDRWETEFRPVTRASHAERDVAFECIEPFIGPFCNAVDIRQINSDRGEVLDYEHNPSLKAIAVGGNRLSRGLTLEGLLVSYFLRQSPNYDTLLQMGRWFGFRRGYEDLMRIHTTTTLLNWFSDLALVEYRLREDVRVYEKLNVTPTDVGLRILRHPAMQITSGNKQRFSRTAVVSLDYSLCTEETLRFRFDSPTEFAGQCEENRLLVRKFLGSLGECHSGFSKPSNPVWKDVPSQAILDFLGAYKLETAQPCMQIPLVTSYIERLSKAGELIRWTIGVCGLQAQDPILGSADWGLATGVVNLVSRTRLKDQSSIGALIDPPDEGLGLPARSKGRAARKLRPKEEGLLLIYPISRFSGHQTTPESSRMPLFKDPRSPDARDIIAIALSFPKSEQAQLDVSYSMGTVALKT